MEEQAQKFYNDVDSQKGFSKEYFKNKDEEVHVRMGDDEKSVRIYYGRNPDERN